jgi:xylulokinase
MARDLYLSVDVGTGSARAALVDANGYILHIASREHEQIVPAHGWSEQRPEDWWVGVAAVLREVIGKVGRDAGRIAALCACGQMHGTVLLDANGELTRDTAPLWNDKRTSADVAAFEAGNLPGSYLAATANPPTPAWPAFKLRWIRDHDPQAFARTAAVLMPKDFINFRLTDRIATDWTEASLSFLMDPAKREWSPEMCARLDLDPALLPTIQPPSEILGHVTASAAQITGLPAGLPVLVGGGDYPVALLGSGVCEPGVVSDVTGTSSIITTIGERPIRDPEISNVTTAEGHWGAFVLLESGGDAVRWARRTLHENRLSYSEIAARAAEAPPGSDALFFLPYLAGERFGEHRNARAQFFGLSAGHSSPHLHRAVLEGVSFAVSRHIRIMEHSSRAKLQRVVASGGGAKNALWLRIKASAYGMPILVPEEAECGVIGCAILAAYATGGVPSLQAGVSRLVRYSGEIEPEPAWSERYARMQPIFDELYLSSQRFYDRLDELGAAPES